VPRHYPPSFSLPSAALAHHQPRPAAPHLAPRRARARRPADGSRWHDRELKAKLRRSGPGPVRGSGFSFRDEPDPALLGDIFCSVDMLRDLYTERYEHNLCRRPSPVVL
jgi:hypothetical protein